MKIGIDIDGVLTNCEQFAIDYFSMYLVKNNIDYTFGESNYFLYKTFGLKQKIEDDFWDEYIKFYSKHEPARPFASEVIKKLKNEGNEIYIITARYLSNREDEIGENMRQTVKNWLLENDIIYDKLIFSKASKERKIEEVKNTKIDVIIEDNPYNVMELSKIVPILCYNNSFNTKCKGKNIIRCISWYDIYKKINEMKKIISSN